MGEARYKSGKSSTMYQGKMKKKSMPWWHWLLPLVPVVGALALLIADTPAQQMLRVNLFDQYQRWQPRAYVDVPVRVVDIDEESLARVGQWPWPRTRIADLVDQLSASGAAVVGFDVMFAEPDRTSPVAAVDLWDLQGDLRREVMALPDHDQVLAGRLAENDVVLGFALERGKQAENVRLPDQKVRFIHAGEPQPQWLHTFENTVASLPILEQAARGNGALSFVPDGDGVVRRVPLVLQVGETPVGTLVSESLRVAQGQQNVFLKSAGRSSGLQEVRIGDYEIPVTPQGDMWVHYSPPAPSRYVPAWRLLEGEVPTEMIEGSIVLIGSSAQGLMDLRFNPFGLMPGVDAHAQALEQILSGHFLQRPSWARGAETLLLIAAGLAIGFVALRASAMVAAASCVAMVAAILGGSWFAYASERLLLDSATPALGVILTFLLCSLAHHLASEREQRWIRNAFSRYVSPNRVAHLVDNPDAMELGGRRQECSFIFTDLAEFTSLMEKIDPGEAVALLNAYLDKMIAIAFRHEGTLDRIVGDAVAIMFSAPVPQPDHRRRALACALEMDAFASAYATDLQAKGIPFGKTRIGVHGGEVIVGNFGGSNIFDYRALGDPVNTAARLESVNKHLGTRICISEFILADCPETRVRPVGRLVLKGKSQALGVFEPVVDDGLSRVPLGDYDKAFELLRTEAPTALECFDALVAAYPQDPLARLHQKRLQAGAQGDRIVMSEK